MSNTREHRFQSPILPSISKGQDFAVQPALARVPRAQLKPTTVGYCRSVEGGSPGPLADASVSVEVPYGLPRWKGAGSQVYSSGMTGLGLANRTKAGDTGALLVRKDTEFALDPSLLLLCSLGIHLWG